jgi:hypothetical protein
MPIFNCQQSTIRPAQTVFYLEFIFIKEALQLERLNYH